MGFDSVFPLYQDWEVLPLGEVCQRGGGNVQTGPFGSQLHASDYVAEGIPSVMPQNIGDNRILDAGIARITEADAQRLSKYRIREGDIIYSRRGDVERRALVRQAEEGWLCGTGCLRIRFGKGIAYPRYAAHYLGHPSVREWIVRHAHGATMPNLNTTILSELPFVLPPWMDQVSIGDAIELYNQKINLNRRINQTLEAMAQAIFKSWFVDFDPVKAKIAAIEQREDPLRAAMRAISGKTDAELDQMPREHYDQLAATAVLFPDEMEESELGEIPKGWKVSTIGEMVEITGGATPDTKNESYWNPPEYFWTSPKDLSGAQSPVLLTTERKISTAGLSRISSGLLRTGTLLMSSRAPIGYLAITQIPLAINQGYIAMLPGGKLPPLMWCQHNMEEIKGQANGSTFMEISKKAFRPMPVIYPGADLLSRFVDVITPIFGRVVEDVREASQLSKLRDTLLPRLISGELRVDSMQEAKHD